MVKENTNNYHQQPPNDDTDLPSYERPEYRESKADWQFLFDMWVGRSQWYHPLKGIVDEQKAVQYLPKEVKEPNDAYKRRLTTPFLRRFEPIVDGFSGLLADFIYDGPAQLEPFFENIDLLGNSLTVFLKECDKMALRDGHCFIMVDYPHQTEEDKRLKTAYDDMSTETQPYFVLLQAIDVLNWSGDFINGEYVITHITIKETVEVPSGLYGVEQKTYYRVLTPGTFQVFELIEDENVGEWTAQLVEEGITSLDKVPVVFYSVSDTVPFCSNPPLVNLAEQNLLHYNVSSDYHVVLHKCNIPVLTRIGFIAMGETEQQPLIIGPNSYIDVPENGDLKYVEPSGAAIEATRNAIMDILKTIDEMALSFLSGNGQEKTATEVSIQSAQTKSFLQTLADQKESAVGSALYFLSSYVGLDDGGTITINKDLLRTPITPEQVIAAFEKNIISQDTAIRKLSELGIVDDPDAEIGKVEGELADKVAKGIIFGQAQQEPQETTEEESENDEDNQQPRFGVN